MNSYAHIGLNNRLQKLTSLPARRTPFVAANDFEADFEVQGKEIIVSRSRVDNLVELTGAVSTSGSIVAGTHVIIALNLNPNAGFAGSRILDNPYIAVYEGTSAVGSMQIYPSVGSGIPSGNFVCYGDFDLADTDNVNSRYRVTVRNTTGTTANIYIDARWRYIMENSGTSS